MNVLEGFMACPHCRGNTRCSCSGCGKTVEEWSHMANQHIKRWVHGTCHVCKGIGQIPIPKAT